MKKYLLPIIYTIGIIIFGSLITSFLYYFNITGDKINSILLYLIGVISIFVGSNMASKRNKQKGIIIGTAYFMMFLIISITLSLLTFKNTFKINSLIYYVILLVFSMLGGIIGKSANEEADIVN